MTRLCITYHLFRDNNKPADDLPHDTETAESCITVCFPEKIARDILDKQVESEYVHCSGREDVALWLDILARLQGYQKGYFASAEAAE